MKTIIKAIFDCDDLYESLSFDDKESIYAIVKHLFKKPVSDIEYLTGLGKDYFIEQELPEKKRKKRKDKIPAMTKECERCGKHYRTKRITQMYCCQKCYGKSKSDKHTEDIKSLYS